LRTSRQDRNLVATVSYWPKLDISRPMRLSHIFCWCFILSLSVPSPSWVCCVVLDFVGFELAPNPTQSPSPSFLVFPSTKLRKGKILLFRNRQRTTRCIGPSSVVTI